MKQKRILLLLTSGLGNCVQATPAILELRRLLPDYKISLFGPQKNLDLLNSPSFADEFVELPAGQSLMRFLFTHPKFLFRKYEYVFSFYCCNPGRLILLKHIGLIRNIYAVRDKANAGYHLDHALDAVPEYHEAQMGLDLLKLARLDVQKRPTDLCLTNEEIEFGKQYFHKRGILERPIIIHPSWTSIGHIKSLPYDFVLKILLLLHQKNQYAFLILGKEELNCFHNTGLQGITENWIISDVPSPRKVASVLSYSSTMISADSGPAHIASAVGVPLFIFYSASIPEHALPWGKFSPVVFRSEKFLCRNCYERKNTLICPMNRPCFPEISPDDFVQKIFQEQLQKRISLSS